ncbi:MAG: AAA family ATPase [Blastocatellia bacterium]|nr:AAA family ATPase [Blastocatellia bacterium]
MYLQQFRLKNIACFDELILDFVQAGSNKPCRWIVLLGENGTGKSTVLQMMALSLLGRDMGREIIPDKADWEKFVRHPSIKGRIEIILSATREDKNRKSSIGSQYLAAFELGRSIKTGLRQDYSGAKADYSKLDETLYAEKLDIGWFSCGYGPWRRLPPHKFLSGSSPELLAASRSKAHRFITLFNQELALTRVSDWLVDLEFRRLKEPGNLAPRRSFDIAIQSIEKVLTGVKFKEITSDRDIIFSDNGIDVSINRLSDGYRGTLSWIGDLIRRLVDAFPLMENPLEASGVVLVDEIDIHLHPKWQRTIVEQVRNLFPNLQFIVSSHSPFVAQDMTEEDKIILLKRDEGRVASQEDEGFVKSWRVDQILTSYLFDLETTRDISIAVAEREYQRLLDLHTTEKVTEKDRENLKKLKESLSKRETPLGETLEASELLDTAQSLIKILDQYLSR